MALKNNIVIKGHRGKWHVVDTARWRGQNVYLLEHSTYGEDAALLIVNDKKEIIINDVWNGFGDLYEQKGR